jgi:hypothetical protein
MFRFMRRASPEIQVIFTIVMVLFLVIALAIGAFILALFLINDCGEMGYENEYGNCIYE